MPSLNRPRRALTSLVVTFLLVPLSIPASAGDDRGLTIPDAVVVPVNSTVDLDGLSISGFPSEANVLVTIAVESGLLDATALGGAAVINNDDLLRISGSPAAVNTTLATVTFTAGASAAVVNVEVSAISTDGNAAANIENSHWYEYVSADGGINWTNAVTAAASHSLGGAPGYLVTVTSQQENDFIQTKLTASGWMGASDAEIEGEWKWVTGPEAGTHFWLGGIAGTAIDGQYNNWIPEHEPNDQGDEDAAHFYVDGWWNDLSQNQLIPGYIVEYGGGEHAVTPDVTGQFSITIYGVADVPSGLTAQAGSGFVDLSWTAPAGDEPVHGYRIEIFDDGMWTAAFVDTGSLQTSARVEGLNNGVTYGFRVAALNVVGAGSWSDTVTATPRAAAPAPACSYNTASYSTQVGGWAVPCWNAPTAEDTASDTPHAWQQDGAAFGIANGLVVRTASGEIGANRNPTRAQVAVMLYALAGQPLTGDAHHFDDISVADRAALDWLAGLGIVQGVGGDQFAADRPISRAEFVTMIWRLAGSPQPSNPHPFLDGVLGWSEDAVRWAHGRGIVNGRSAESFDPNAPATVAEVLAVIFGWVSTLDS